MMCLVPVRALEHAFADTALALGLDSFGIVVYHSPKFSDGVFTINDRGGEFHGSYHYRGLHQLWCL